MFKEVQLLKNAGPIEKLIYEIKFLASKGKSYWIGCIAQDSHQIAEYFREQGFQVTRDGLIYTISWRDDNR